MGDASENAERPILNVEGNLVALGSLRRDLPRGDERPLLRRGGFATAF
jgi:hypothetical protein